MCWRRHWPLVGAFELGREIVFTLSGTRIVRLSACHCEGIKVLCGVKVEVSDRISSQEAVMKGLRRQDVVSAWTYCFRVDFQREQRKLPFPPTFFSISVASQLCANQSTFNTSSSRIQAARAISCIIFPDPISQHCFSPRRRAGRSATGSFKDSGPRLLTSCQAVFPLRISTWLGRTYKVEFVAC